MIHDLVICVSDLHIPFHHPDAFKFLKAIKAKYWAKAKNPIIVIGGDELTWSSLSFHDKNPSMPNGELEYKLSLLPITELYKIFPKAKVLESNHGSLLYRKGKHHGIAKDLLKHYNEILQIPRSDWQWHRDLILDLGDVGKAYFCHGRASDVTKLSQLMGMNVIQFHYHEKFKIEYWGTTVGYKWAMQCGCLIDNNSDEFEYNRLNLKTPIIGTGVIVKGTPILHQMVLDQKGRWNGVLI